MRLPDEMEMRSPSSFASGPTAEGQRKESDETFDSPPPPPPPSRSWAQRLSFASIIVTAFVLSIEYAVVIPSIWLYLRQLDETVGEYVLGLSIGCYGLTAMVMQPVVGLWLDRRFIREVLVFQMWAVLAGNLVYFMSVNVYMVVLSRFICGVGGTVFLSVSVYIIRTTTEQERSGSFAFLQAGMMGGMVVGPALNYFLVSIPTFSVTPWLTISPYNSVGLMMVVVQLACLGFLGIFFVEPPPSTSAAPTQTSLGAFSNLKAIISFSTLSIIVSHFIAIFNQAALEVVLTPLLLSYYGFHQFQNSLFYFAMTLYMLVAFSVVGGVLARKLQVADRNLMIGGWTCLCLGVVILFFGERYSSPHMPLWLFGVGQTVFATSSAFFESSVGSLFSKLVARQKGEVAQSQSVLMMFQTLATILGPVIVSPVLTQGFIYVLVMIWVLWALTFTFFLFAYRSLRLDPPAVVSDIASGDESGIGL